MMLRVILAGIAVAYSNQLLADDMLCNKQQTRCFTEDRDLSIGDEVGVFTTKDELVAVGTVRAMRGAKRMVSIKESTGTIRKGYRLALLERNSSDADFSTNYKIYRNQAEISAGASLGMATAGVGQGAVAFDTSAFGAMRLWRDVEMVGRFNYLTFKGSVNRSSPETMGIETAAFSVDGLGLLGGIGYTWMHNNPLSVRGEFGVGFMHVTADVGGDAGDVEGAGYPMLVSNGFGKFIRGGVSGLYNLKDWKLELALSNAWFHEAMATGASLGLIKDLR